MKNMTKLFAVAALRSSLAATTRSSSPTRPPARLRRLGNGSFPAAARARHADRSPRSPGRCNTALNHVFDGTAGMPGRRARGEGPVQPERRDPARGLGVRRRVREEPRDPRRARHWHLRQRHLRGPARPSAVEGSAANCLADCGRPRRDLRLATAAVTRRSITAAPAVRPMARSRRSLIRRRALPRDEQGRCARAISPWSSSPGVLGGTVSPTCGGRAPSYDVIDLTYTLACDRHRWLQRRRRSSRRSAITSPQHTDYQRRRSRSSARRTDARPGRGSADRSVPRR